MRTKTGKPLPIYEDEEIYAVEAEYKEEKISEFKDNPMEAALPPLPPDDEFLEIFSNVPKVTQEERQLSKEERATLISCMRDILLPAVDFISAAKDFFTMIRVGYRNRNPFKWEDLKIIREQKKITSQNHLKKEGLKINTNQSSIQEIKSIIGISGSGKTTTVQTFKRMLPNCIRHTKFKGRKIRRIQVPVLHVVCPHDGSIKGLLQNILKAMDETLSANQEGLLYNWAVSQDINTNRLMMEIAKMVQMYSVGIIFLDEAQNLGNSRQEKDSVSAFITNIANLWQIPVVFVGTPDLENVMGTDMNVIRRMSAYGSNYWGRIPEDSKDWNDIINVLWSVQYTKTYTKLTDKLRKAIYDKTQGIIALVVSLLMMVQLKVIYDPENEDEIIRVKDINSVYNEDFRPLHKVINAIKNNDISQLKSFDNILFDLNNKFDVVKATYQETDRMVQMQEAVNKSKRGSLQKRILKTIKEMHKFSCPDSTLNRIIKTTIQHRGDLVQKEELYPLVGVIFPKALEKDREFLENRKRRSRKIKKQEGLIGLYNDRINQKLTGYGILKENGFIEEVTLD